MTLLEEISSGKYNLVLFGILFVFMFHQYWNKKTESMTDVGNLDQIKEAVKQVYMADVESIRNLSNVASQLQAGGLTIPGDLTVKGNISTPANLTVTGAFNMIPKGTIFAYNSEVVPEGWALCDGKDGRPDLRGRFLVGYDVEKPDYNKIGKKGGEDFHKLIMKEMPSHNHGAAGQHTHTYTKIKDGSRSNACNSCSGSYLKSLGSDNLETSIAGNHEHAVQGSDEPHENRPPFYVVTYIIKL